MNRGFAMVEMLVAVALIFLVLPGALSISTKAITMSSYQKDQMIATYLAEEGQDVVRSIRDRNVLKIINGSYGHWNTSFAACKTTACRIDSLSEALSNGSGNLEDLSVAPNAVYRLYVDENGFYSHSADTPTPFYRGVFIVPSADNPTDQALVRSVVVWETPYGRREVSSSGFLAHWLQ